MSLFTKGTSVIGGLAGLGAGIAQGFFGSRRDGAQSPYNIQDISSRLNEVNGLYKPNLYFVQIHAHNAGDFWLNDTNVGTAGPNATSGQAHLKDAINKPLGLSTLILVLSTCSKLSEIVIFIKSNAKFGLSYVK